MQHNYSKALYSLITTSDIKIEELLVRLKEVLKARHHEKLYETILTEVIRFLENDTDNVIVKKATDLSEKEKGNLHTVLAKFGVTEKVSVKEEIDETLIGGFVATYKYREENQSYKQALKSLYESITI
jgi:F-type H+-transporting ATPase subunit delta